MNKNLLSILAMGALFSSSSLSYAQSALDAAGTIADPSRVGQEVKKMEIENIPTAEAKTTKIKTVKSPEGADKIFFVLDNLLIDGVTIYKQEELEKIYKKHLGKKISLEQLFDIASSITVKYRNDGYILTQVIVPPQEIENGTARLRVVEGFIDKVNIQGDEKEEEKGGYDIIRKYASKLQLSGPLNTHELERVLLLINDLAGLKARSILSPSKTTSGAADLTILVERDKLNIYTEFNNYGSRYIGEYQLTAAASINSFFGYNERITATMAYAPDSTLGSEMSYGGVNIDIPVFGNGVWFNSALSITETDPGFDLEALDVEGQSVYGKIGFTHKLIRTRTNNLEWRYYFDWRNVSSRNNVETNKKDKIRVIRTGLKHEFLDNIFGTTFTAFNAIDIEIAKGIDMFGASNEGQPNMSRLKGDPQFFKGNIEIQRLQRLSNKVNFFTAAKGQMSSDSLPSSEEFGVGGSNYGRGYDSSEIIGDHGVAAKAEIQWNSPKEIEGLSNYQLYAFYDAGHIWNQDATTSKLKQETATSAGIGARLDLDDKTKVSAMIAFPLNRIVQTKRDDNPRIFFNLSRRF